MTTTYEYDKLKEHVGHNIECVSYASGDNIALECVTCNVVLYSEDFTDADAPNPTPITLIYTSADRKMTLDLDISSYIAQLDDRALGLWRSRFKRSVEEYRTSLLGEYADDPQVAAFIAYVSAHNAAFTVRAEINDLYAWVEANRAYLMVTP